jgi:CheY-like chemotaxis protein
VSNTALSKTANREVILVIGDDPFAAGVTARLLDFAGYRVVLAQDAWPEAELASDLVRTVNAVVLNLREPNSDVAAAVGRTRRLSGDAPIVLCTPSPREEIQTQISNDSSVEILSKPYLFTELQIAVRKAARLRHAPSFSRPISP